ncbi:hypothetical protein Q5424_17245 [Conexibacter sp. JD483]|uniref:hypothetical protein n=1 Tax=unclassified Conexibacter TaxID=2627773 RepID=UPI0027167C4D|nr:MULTISPECIES: hypothetical protein [unclassified Conexibacter]MDO8188673.1 hypothetical protein [Conexibacter sp. CPCC 205706]MDO8199354.1 hypothetical protein [Conexibacter sp. CPCC 205762]MDR9370846.1 hypothetical protein [Conexibacter sp. JD483]
MRLRTRVASAAVVVSAAASLAFAGNAVAAFPDFTGCPLEETPGAWTCLDVQSTAGTLRFGTAEVALGSSLEIRGALVRSGPISTVVPAAGTTGLTATPLAIPGGLTGSGSTSPLNRLTVEIKLAGSGPITLASSTTALTLPVKLKLKNPLLGSCHIGSDSEPIQLALTPSSRGTFDDTETYFSFLGNQQATDAFAVPAVKGCVPFNRLLSARLGVPAATGNSFALTSNFGFTY